MNDEQPGNDAPRSRYVVMAVATCLAAAIVVGAVFILSNRSSLHQVGTPNAPAAGSPSSSVDVPGWTGIDVSEIAGAQGIKGVGVLDPKNAPAYTPTCFGTDGVATHALLPSGTYIVDVRLTGSSWYTYQAIVTAGSHVSVHASTGNPPFAEIAPGLRCSNGTVAQTVS